jgi:hypothetical protein
MIVGDDIKTMEESLCFCGPSWADRRAKRQFFITAWNLGPYQEYRCSYCGNMALLDTRNNVFMVQVLERPMYDMKEQTEWYSKHCRSVK